MRLAAAAIGMALCLALAQEPGPARPAPEGAAGEGRVERGRHLVHEVAHCIQCHTPRDDEGRLIELELLQGAAVPIAPPDWGHAGRGWAVRAPQIAGLPGYTDELALRLLTEGIDASGTPPRRPMPPFRLTVEEARDVIAYLRSLE